MRILDGQLVLSPSDLSNFLTCRHRAGLDLAAARKVIEKPRYEDPYVAMLGRHGDEHERAYVDQLRAQGLAIVNAGLMWLAIRLFDRETILTRWK